MPSARSAPGRRRPTSAEVAARAQVSRTTVSFVLNGVTDQGISEATRLRVLQAAQDLGYEPHAAARTLAGGSTGTVALVVPSTAHLYVDAFLAQLVASINEQCHRRGLKLLIETTEGEGREPGGFLQLVRSRRIDGLIVAHLRTAELGHLQRLRDSGVPLVVLGCGLPEGETLHAMGDDTWRSARRAVTHLLGLGHQAIGFVNYARPEFHSASQRERGWREALADAGIEARPDWLAHADISAESGWQATRALLARQPRRRPVTALFAGNDTIAFGALRALHEAGLRVPDDVAGVGYDDIPLAAIATPPRTTVRSDPVSHGRQAVALLCQQLGLADAASDDLAPAPELVIRRSCGAEMAPASDAAPAPASTAAVRNRSR